MEVSRDAATSLGFVCDAHTSFLPADDDLCSGFLHRSCKQERMSTKAIRLSLLVMGSVLLLFGLWNWLIPRARYVTSNPRPGAMVATTPSAVTVDFSEELDVTSRISVASTITLSAAGERIYGDGKRFIVNGPAAHDSTHRTLYVALDPDLPTGLYWVQWNAVAARGKSQRSGSFCYGVGMSVPDDIMRDMPGAIYERNYRFRDHRAVVLGGLLLVGLGLFLPQLRVSK